MAKFKITAHNTQYYSALVEADTAEEALIKGQYLAPSEFKEEGYPDFDIDSAYLVGGKDERIT